MDDLLEPDFQPSFSAFRDQPGPETRGRLLRDVQPVLQRGIETYAAGDKSPLLQSKARRIALDAFKTYDPARASLKTHLMNNLQGLRRAQASQNQIIHTPEQVRLDRGYVFEAENRLRDWQGRDPTDEELSDDTGLSLKRLAHIRKAHDGVPEGALSRTGSEDEGYSPPVLARDDGSGWNDFVYGSLTPVDRLVMEYTWGMNGRRPLSGVRLAARLGVTPAAVSQRKAKIQKMLNARQELGVL